MFIICTLVVSKLSPTIAAGISALMELRKLLSGIKANCAWALFIPHMQKDNAMMKVKNLAGSIRLFKAFFFIELR